MDKVLRVVLRRERQRQLGEGAAQPLSDESAAWLEGARVNMGHILGERSDKAPSVTPPECLG